MRTVPIYILRWLVFIPFIFEGIGEFALAQSKSFSKTFDRPQKSIGIARSVMKKDSGGYLLISSSRTNGKWGRKLLFYELNENGDTLRSSMIGGGKWESYAGSVWSDGFAKAKDSGYYRSGAYRDTSGVLTAVLYRINPDLDTNWTRRYGENDTLKEAFLGIERLPSGGVVICGKKEDDTYGSKAWFLRTDSLGNILWEQKVGANHDGPFQANAIESTSDGGFIAAGELGPWHPSGNEVPSGLLVKLDSNGQKEWKRAFKGSYGYFGTTVLETKDSNYVIGGTKNIPNSVVESRPAGFIRKYDPNGQLLWEQVYAPDTSGDFYTSRQWLYALSETKDGKLLGCGWRELSPFLPEQVDSTEDGWVFKATSDGKEIWQRYHRHALEGDFRLWDVEPTKRGMIASGYSNDADSTNDESMNAWVLKLDSAGCLQPGCAVGIKKRPKKALSELHVYPNPAQEVLHIDLPENKGAESKLRIWNSRGRLMEEKRKEENRHQLNVSEYSKGVYFLEWKSSFGIKITRSFIVH